MRGCLVFLLSVPLTACGSETVRGDAESDVDATDGTGDSSDNVGEEEPFDRLTECAGWTLPAEVVAHGTLDEGSTDRLPCHGDLPRVYAVGMDGEFWVMAGAMWVVSLDGAARREWVWPDTCTDRPWDMRSEVDLVMLLRGHCTSLLDSTGIESEPTAIFDDSVWPGDQVPPVFIDGADGPEAIAHSEPGIWDWGLRKIPLQPDGTRIEAGPYIRLSDLGWEVQTYDNPLHAGRIGEDIHITFKGGSDEPRHSGLIHMIVSGEGTTTVEPLPVPGTDRVSAEIWSTAHTNNGTVVGWWSTGGPLSECLTLTWIPHEATNVEDLITGPDYYLPWFFHAVEARNLESFVSVVKASYPADLCADFRVSYGWDPALPEWGPPVNADIAGGVGSPCHGTGALARSDNLYIFVWWESYELEEDTHDYALQYVILELP